MTMMTVKDATKNEHELVGRLETIVALLIENSGEIVRPQNAQIVFDCAGGKVSASIRHQLEISRPEA
jgi:hypothetical protein